MSDVSRTDSPGPVDGVYDPTWDLSVSGASGTPLGS